MSDLLTPNQKAIANLDKRMKNISACRQKEQEALADPAYRKNQGAVRKLIKDSDDRFQALKTEKEIRQELAQAEASPQNREKIAAVKKKLADHCKKYPCYYGKQKVKDPCFKCGAGLKGLRDPTYPTWCKYSKRNPYGGGWVFAGSPHLSIAKYKGWDELIKSGRKTASEKKVITSVASNEGKFNSVQTYDSEAVSAGVMQKTVNIHGEGELPGQIARFKKNEPDKYKDLFENKGWTVQKDTITTTTAKGEMITGFSDYRLYYKDPGNTKMTPMTGAKLKEYLCQKNPEVAKKVMTPLKQAGEEPAFQKQQVLDYNSRLLEMLKNRKPKGHDFPLRSYVTSERGTALLLDQSVNAPNNLTRNFGQALDRFYTDHPGVSRNPSQWMSNRQQYEKEILEHYKSHRTMTDSEVRCERIATNSELRDEPYSMELPP
jgi:hypothetical protein